MGKELSHAAFSFEANVAIDSFLLKKEYPIIPKAKIKLAAKASNVTVEDLRLKEITFSSGNFEQNSSSRAVPTFT